MPDSESIELISYYPTFVDYYPKCELQTKKWFVDNVETDWVCIDAGANIGYHSILMARMAAEGAVHSFEPTSTFEMLVANLEHNKTSNVVPIKKALGAASGVRRDKIYRLWGNAAEPGEYEFTTIDEYVFQKQMSRLDLIKIDVDGFDYEALQGANKTLDFFSPVVIVELNHALATRNRSVTDVMRLMLDHKYSQALVLDGDNFVFTKNWTLGDPWPSKIDVAFDFRQGMLSQLRLQKGTEKLVSNFKTVLHNDAITDSDGNFVLVAPAWSYALSIPFTNEMRFAKGLSIRFELAEGSLGVFITDKEGKVAIGEEVRTSQLGPNLLVFDVDHEKATQIIFRTIDTGELKFKIQEIYFGQISTSRSTRKASFDANLQGRIRVVSKSELPTLFQSKVPLENMQGLYDPLEILMERNDAPILKWIYEVRKPKRHFEFGTWEGFGALLCLKSCEAHVWTINLPTGEMAESGRRYAESREPLTKDSVGLKNDPLTSDSGSDIGWMYRVAGQQHRVTQLFGDSSNFDFSELALTKFDTILIDGGHTPEVVEKDQINALKILAEDGLVVWHDFTLDEAVLSAAEASRGVVDAVVNNIEFLSEKLELFWVEGSLLLIGVPKPQ